MENGFSDLDVELARLDDELMSLTNQFTGFAEEVLPSLTDRLLSLKELSQRRDKHAASLKTLYASLDRESANFFDLDTDVNASERVVSLVEELKQKAKSIEEEREEEKELRNKIKKEMKQVLQWVEQFEEKIQKLEEKEQQRQEAEKTGKWKDMCHLMGTQFRMDKDKRLVALILSKEQQVETVVLVEDSGSRTRLQNTFQDTCINDYWERASKIDT